MNNYIDKKTKIRIELTTEFGEILPKSMNCSFYEKQMENIRKKE